MRASFFLSNFLSNFRLVAFDYEGDGITTTADYQHVAAMLADIASRLTADGDVDAEVILNFSLPPACNIECLVIDAERAAAIVRGRG